MRASGRAAAVLMVLAALVTASVQRPLPAHAKGGEVGGSGDRYLLSNTFGSAADVEISYGAVGDQTYVGDWDGNGTDTLAVRRGSTFYVRRGVLLR